MPQPLFFEDRQGSHSDSEPEEIGQNDARIQPLSDEALPEKTRAVSRSDAQNNSTGEDAEVTNEGSGPDDDDKNQPQPENVTVQMVGQSEENFQSTSDDHRKAVWIDDDDDLPSVNLHSVKRRRKLRKAMGETHVSAPEYTERVREMYSNKMAASVGGAGTWAELPSELKRRRVEQNEVESVIEDDESDDDDDPRERDVDSLLQSTAKLLKSRSRAIGSGVVDQEHAPLRSGVLNLRRVANANQEDPNKAEARCIDFHPTGRLLLTAGLDKTLRIFQVDGKQNAKVQGVHMRNFPIHTAKFTGSGSQVIMAGRRKFFHQLDMNSGTVSTVHALSTHPERAWERFQVSADGSKLAFFGQQGKIVLLSNKSKREIGQLRLNARVACVSFAAQGDNENHIYASSEDGTVYLWDARQMDCIDRHKDEGAIHSTSLATSADHYALGSDSGVLNIYSSAAMRTAGKGTVFGTRTEKPKKSFFNLTTTIDNLAFNADGKLLAFSSHDKKDAVRIAHIPSLTVYSNWPTARANLRRVCSLQFSPNSGYLAVGNDKGDVQLMRLPSYPAS